MCWTANFRVAPSAGWDLLSVRRSPRGVLATGAVHGARYRYAEAGPEVLAKVARIEAVCARHGVTLAAAALQFPLGHKSVAAVIPGVLLPEHVARNVAAFRQDIPAGFWGELKHEGLLRADAPVP